MKYLYIILSFLIFTLPMYAVDSTLERQDSSICVVKGNMQKLQDELIVSFELGIDRQLRMNESVVLVPMVQDSMGRSVTLPKIYINSRNQYIMLQRGFYGDVDMSKALRRKNGTHQTLYYLESLPYSSWMDASTLVVNEESCGCGLPISSDIAFTADITTPYTLPEELPSMAYVMPDDFDVKQRVEKGTAFILFQLNDTVVIPSLNGNKEELDKIIHSIDVIKSNENYIVTGISIHGYASPEGSYKLNERLARGRTNAVKEYVDDIYNFPQGVLHTEYTPEDWIGFEALLESSSYSFKGEILEIIHSDMTPDQKEAKIRSGYPQFFKMLLGDWFKLLRHTNYEIEYKIRSYNTVETIEEIYNTTPFYLSLKELFLLAKSYKEGSEERNNVFMKSVLLYPDDPIANLNAAYVSLNRRDLSSARRYLELAPECGEKDMAQGIYYLLTKDYEQSLYYLKEAEKKGIEKSQSYIKIHEKINY